MQNYPLFHPKMRQNVTLIKIIISVLFFIKLQPYVKQINFLKNFIFQNLCLSLHCRDCELRFS